MKLNLKNVRKVVKDTVAETRVTYDPELNTYDIYFLNYNEEWILGACIDKDDTSITKDYFDTPAQKVIKILKREFGLK